MRRMRPLDCSGWAVATSTSTWSVTWSGRGHRNTAARSSRRSARRSTRRKHRGFASASIRRDRPDSFTFFTPIAAELPVRSRQEQIHQQAALLTGTRDPAGLDLASQTVRTAQDSEGEAVMWVHVLATPGPVHERLGHLASSLPVSGFDWVVSTQAAARVAAQTDLTGITQAQALRPFTLSVGRYDGHTEYTLSRDRQWYHSHYTHEADTPTDRLYFAIGLLNRLGVSPGAVGRLFVYGLDVDSNAYAPFQTIFGVEPETLDPLSALRADRSRFGTSLDVGAYAPCVGALL